MVIVASPSGSKFYRRMVMVRLWRALARFPVAKDILVYGRDEVERCAVPQSCHRKSSERR